MNPSTPFQLRFLCLSISTVSHKKIADHHRRRRRIEKYDQFQYETAGDPQRPDEYNARNRELCFCRSASRIVQVSPCPGPWHTTAASLPTMNAFIVVMRPHMPAMMMI